MARTTTGIELVVKKPPATEVPALLKDFCARVKESTSPAISLLESGTSPKQLLARIEQEAVGARQQELVHHVSEATSFSLSFMSQRQRLLQVLANPHAPESEWLRACEALGDYQYNPGPRTGSLRILLFAVCASASVVIYALSMHMLKDNPTYIIAQPPRVEAPMPVAPKVEVSYGPYMADMQRRIKRAWFPPRDLESRRVVVVFKVHEHGELSDMKLTRSSGIANADQAALMAVQNASPFRPLPPGASEPVDIQFTFDYNLFSGKAPGAFHK